jgi:hypothetical protein
MPKEKCTLTGESRAVTKSKLVDGVEKGKKPYFKLVTEQKVTFNAWPGEQALITLGKEHELDYTESTYDGPNGQVTSRWVVLVDGQRGARQSTKSENSQNSEKVDSAKTGSAVPDTTFDPKEYEKFKRDMEVVKTSFPDARVSVKQGIDKQAIVKRLAEIKVIVEFLMEELK